MMSPRQRNDKLSHLFLLKREFFVNYYIFYKFDWSMNTGLNKVLKNSVFQKYFIS